MIALDTNVLVRLLVKDEAKQAALAQSYLREPCSNENPAWINRVVLAEFVWVLESYYEYPKERVAAALEGILTTAILKVEEAAIVRSALTHYRNEGAEFADALIALTNAAKGAEMTLTFDKSAARRLTEFTLLQQGA
jgi:predicted nucleic-acid-binding protein